MYSIREINDNLYWVGGNDRRLALFENVFPIPKGISYNSYILLDDKTVLFDTVDYSASRQFFENVGHVLNGRPLDYLVINHMEPDHCACVGDIIARYSGVQIVCNAKTVAMLKQFFDFEIDSRVVLVKEGDVLETGSHSLTFVMAPMVHWPEVMVTYDSQSKTLFSADAFGTFGALNGNIFADEIDFERDWLDEARRYYTNIVGKYGAQVQALLKKASALDIRFLCPLHGPIWRENIEYFVRKYDLWSSYASEEKSVLIAYASVYGDTANAAEILAGYLAEKGVKNIAVFDVSATDASYIVSEAFKRSHIVFASTTYNAGIFCKMDYLLSDLKAHNLQNKTVALIQNGSWAPAAAKLMSEILSEMKNITVLDNTVSIKSSLKENQLEELQNLAEAICKSL